uniref:Uncharacterized protein n=1 Tax=Lepeophtheirus salmonis TaxID=72036 RepID=A0A0K2UPU1_LEPSM
MNWKDTLNLFRTVEMANSLNDLVSKDVNGNKKSSGFNKNERRSQSRERSWNKRQDDCVESVVFNFLIRMDNFRLQKMLNAQDLVREASV